MKKTILRLIFIFLIVSLIQPCFAVVLPYTGSVKEKSEIENANDQIRQTDKTLEYMEKEDSRFIEILKLKINDGNTSWETILQEINRHEEYNIKEIRVIRSDLNLIKTKEGKASGWEGVYWMFFIIVCGFVAAIVIGNIKE